MGLCSGASILSTVQNENPRAVKIKVLFQHSVAKQKNPQMQIRKRKKCLNISRCISLGDLL